ncbi:MAG: translation elongation factor-like protein [Nanoarchaeota archaeon]|nr:translation elongation factor-like protein [Nanoarchaeota archaeon]
MNKILVGKITHFFPKINVAVVQLSAELKTGDKISIEKDGEAFEQIVESMQVEHKNIPVAKVGMDVGMKISHPVKEGAQVFKLTA